MGLSCKVDFQPIWHNGHRLKPFYEGWTTELTASVELAKPVYEEWACHMSSHWHKTKALTRRQPSTKRKKIDLLFFSLSFIFWILLYFCHSLIFLFSLLRQKKNYVWSFWTPIGLWEYEYYVWELVEIDEDINRMNKCACKF
jgi:hypothetical protein